MLFYNFKNYEDFLFLFGVTKNASGFSRKNKTLLAVLKQPETLVALRRERYGDDIYGNDLRRAAIATCTSQAQAVQRVFDFARDGECDLILDGRPYASPDFRTDEFHGTCRCIYLTNAAFAKTAMPMRFATSARTTGACSRCERARCSATF